MRALGIVRFILVSLVGPLLLLVTGNLAADSRVAPTAESNTCHKEPLWISGGKLWQADGSVLKADLLVDDGRIFKVIPGGIADAPGYKQIPAQGMTLLPGLIDLHTHFFELGGPLPAQVVEADIDRNFAVIARSLLFSGVTTVRAHLMNLEQGPRLSQRAADDCFAAPRIEYAGPGLFGGLPDMERFQVWGVNDIDDARDKVRRIAASGAGWIAIHRAEHFRPGELEAIAAQARAMNLRILGAGNNPEAILRLLTIHPDTLDYLPDLDSGKLPQALHDALWGMDQPPIFVPMIAAPLRDRDSRENPNRIDFGPLNDWLPDTVIDDIRSDLLAQYAQPMDPDYAKAITHYRAAFKQYLELNLPLGMGTDSGSATHFHYDAIWREMAQWSDLGVSSAQILTAATQRGAQALGLPDIGSIEAGSIADLVLYRGDLEQAEFSQDQVYRVIKGGIVYAPQEPLNGALNGAAIGGIR